ncbi:MAG: hypothetical protein GY922_04310 [Proteobacteria bacterium]|nr:hypothetical protein [Pseudomonadota bacterium]
MRIASLIGTVWLGGLAILFVIVGLRLLARTYVSRDEAINSGFARLASQGVAV